MPGGILNSRTLNFARLLLAGLASVGAAAYYPLHLNVLLQNLEFRDSQAPLVPICRIQGRYFTSPFAGYEVRVQGLVTLDLDEASRRGFFMQHDACDADSVTSDGLFVYLSERKEAVQAGDWVEVEGLVQEYYGLTELLSSPDNITHISSGNLLPAPVALNPPFDNDSADGYFESLEGMVVGMQEAVTVGPTDESGQSWVVSSSLGISRVFQDDLRGTGELVTLDDRGLFEVNPDLKVGDRIFGLVGALDYGMGLYRLQLAEEPSVLPSAQPVAWPLTQSQESKAPLLPPDLQAPDSNYPDMVEYSLVTFNLHNLYDTVDDPLKEDPVYSPAEYQRRLAKRALGIHYLLEEPDLLAVQEVENPEVLQALVNQPVLEARYGFLLEDGPDRAGSDLALLYRTDRVLLLSHRVRQGCTTLQDGLGPDGNQDVLNPYNTPTCDTDSDGHLDGNRLFSRPPLLVEISLCLPSCTRDVTNAQDSRRVWLVINHFKSRREDTPLVPYTLPRRLQQAEFVAGLVREQRIAHPDDALFVLGDLNDYPASQTLLILASSGMHDLTGQVEKADRYTYIYQGISQVLDYLLVYPSPVLYPLEVGAVHFNADFPAVYQGQDDTAVRSSDHDPLLLRFAWFENLTYLPIVISH